MQLTITGSHWPSRKMSHCKNKHRAVESQIKQNRLDKTQENSWVTERGGWREKRQRQNVCVCICVRACVQSLTGPLRSMSSCLIWTIRWSLAMRERYRRSLNSISSPCISATCSTHTHTEEQNTQKSYYITPNYVKKKT